MFDVGFSELVLLFIIGLLILGPERLPRVAAQLGRWVARARRTATQLRMQFEREMAMQEIMKRKPSEPPKGTKSSEPPPKDEAKSDSSPEGVPPAQGASAARSGTEARESVAAPADADESR